MTAHAFLSASASHRWLKCTPSAKLEKQFPDTKSEYAAEGTKAHDIAEKYLFAYLNGTPVATPPKDIFSEVLPYIEYAIERISAARTVNKDALILVEEKLNFSRWVPRAYGTGDLVIVTEGYIEVIDLKFGKGVPVEAENNSQMRCYGLGALDMYGHLYDPKKIIMTIHQPRLDSISTEELSVDELLAWGEEIRPLARKAFAGEGEFVAGDHCKFCRAKEKCRARSEANLEIAKYEFNLPELLDDEEIADILARIDRFVSWAEDIKSYAFNQAVQHHKKWPGFKLVEGRSNRKYIDNDKVADKLIASGVQRAVIYEEVLLGITAMEKTIGKKVFQELLADLIIKPPGKPTLVPESDKRPEINSLATAINDFEGEM